MKVIVLFALVAFCAVSVSAWSCYVCTKDACDDLTDSKKTTCAAPNVDTNRCTSHGKEDDRIHACAPKDTEEKTFCESKTDCIVCSEENCNSSSSVLASAALIAASAILLKMYN